jgi:hypothetical protein
MTENIVHILQKMSYMHAISPTFCYGIGIDVFTQGLLMTLEDQLEGVSFITTKLVSAPVGERGLRDSLAWRLGEMLFFAEDLFGERDRSFTFLGFEVVENGPRLQHGPYNNMIIQLHPKTLEDPTEAYYEMAHECVHMISPIPTQSPSILEEGLAVIFSAKYLREVMGITRTPPAVILFDDLPAVTRSYYEASFLAGQLLSFDLYGIKAMREKQPIISKISKDLILEHCPTLPEPVAERLAEPFVRGGETKFQPSPPPMSLVRQIHRVTPLSPQSILWGMG